MNQIKVLPLFPAFPPNPVLTFEILMSLIRCLICSLQNPTIKHPIRAFSAKHLYFLSYFAPTTFNAS